MEVAVLFHFTVGTPTVLPCLINLLLDALVLLAHLVQSSVDTVDGVGNPGVGKALQCLSHIGWFDANVVCQRLCRVADNKLVTLFSLTTRLRCLE